MEQNSIIENFEMKLNATAKDFLKETAKWAYFLSILGYIVIALIVCAALFASTLFGVMARMNPMLGMMGSSFVFVIAFIYIAMAALYFFPVYYLNKFAFNAKLALKNNDSDALMISLGYLKSHYKYIGVMAVVVLSIYLLILLGAILAAFAGNSAY